MRFSSDALDCQMNLVRRASCSRVQTPVRQPLDQLQLRPDIGFCGIRAFAHKDELLGEAHHIEFLNGQLRKSLLYAPEDARGVCSLHDHGQADEVQGQLLRNQ
jgi:hypothetical protein